MAVRAIRVTTWRLFCAVGSAWRGSHFEVLSQGGHLVAQALAGHQDLLRLRALVL